MAIPKESALVAHRLAGHLRAAASLYADLDEGSKATLLEVLSYTGGLTTLAGRLEEQNPLPPLSEDDKDGLFRWLCEQEEENCDTIRNRVRNEMAGATDADWHRVAIDKEDYEKAIAEEDEELLGWDED